MADLNPSRSLLSSNLPFPPSTRSTHSQPIVDLAFTNFNTVLNHRRSNRTPLLDLVVSTVEDRLRGLQSELESAAKGRFAKEMLLTRFGPLEDQLGTALIKCLDAELENIVNGQDDVAMDLVVFIGRVASCFSTSLSFIEDKVGSGKSVKGVSLIRAYLSVSRFEQNFKMVPTMFTLVRYLYGNQGPYLNSPLPSRSHSGTSRAIMSLTPTICRCIHDHPLVYWKLLFH